MFFFLGWLVGWFVGFYGVSTFVGLFNAKFCLYVHTFNQRFLNEYLLGKIFYKQDSICLHMINQF